MAGKRLLDAAKLFNAGRSIAKQHLVLRQDQWEVYTKTSSLAKAARTQTDRVTVTAGAAIDLAKRFNEEGPSWQQREPDAARAQEQTIDHRASTTRSIGHEGGHAAVRGTSALNAAGEDDGTLSSLRNREMQRMAERQIPSQTADAQPEPAQSHGQDTFNERAVSTSPQLSSIPRAKIPRRQDESQPESVKEKDINQEVFYTAKDQTTIPEKSSSEDFSLDGIIASPKVSRMISKDGTEDRKNPYAGRPRLPPQPLPEMRATERARSSRKEEDTAQVSSHSSRRQDGEVHKGDTETQQLAESIMRDTEAQPTDPQSAVQQSGPQPASPYEMRESRVPASRFGRLWQYGGLATSMAFGAVGEGFRRFAGGGSEGSLMLSEANMERLVAKLSRMRGAALKLGQMMSFQDSKILPPTINAVLQRVQDSADYMPPSQRNKVLVRDLGENWRDLFSNFEERPFAAASIGQVHKATLASNGKEVAVKVQYPGVRNSIDSDLNNLSLLLTASKLLPKGLFLDKTIANARVELGWECDYEREARACIRFKDLLRDECEIFAVPTIYTEASGPSVLTAEFLTGTAVTKNKDLSQEDRDWIGTHILRLCLRELMEWRFMQTDPNWTNFLFNPRTRRLELLDFGASRDFPDMFVEPYVELLIAASKGDRERCRDLSIELGYLTGQEGKGMLKAHVNSILTLAEPFVETAPEVYDFKDQTITDRVRTNIGLMLKERLAPPPEETYSLHRKLSGAFLLCARLQSRIRAREMFADAVRVWRNREARVKL